MKCWKCTLWWCIMLLISLWGIASVLAQEKVKIEYWILGTSEELAIEQKAVQMFEERNPHIDVVERHAPGEEYYDKLRASIAAGSVPDLMRIIVEEYQSFAKGGVLLDIKSIVEERIQEDEHFASWWNDIEPKLLEPFYYQGGLFGIPHDWNDAIIFYNKTLFDKAGLSYPTKNWNINEFLEIAKKLTVDEDGDGKADQYGYLLTGDWFDCIAPWIFTFGGKILDEEWKKCLMNTTESRQAMQFMYDLVNTYRVSPAPTVMEFTSGMAMWMTGKIGMAHYGRYMVPAFRQIKDFEWDCQHQPFGPGGTRGIPYGVGLTCIAAKTKYPEESFELAMFLSSLEVQQMYNEYGNSIQVLRSIIYSDEFKNPSKPPFNQYAMVEALEYAQLIPSPPRNREIIRIATSELDRILLGQKSIDQAAQDMTAQIDEILGEE
ncbi:MAG: sugar ABC transporter substrate-binding protein [Nitrososphaerota archaeon]